MLYMIGGNHDAWSGDDDPITWISKRAGTLYQSSAKCGCSLCSRLATPGTINARHDFKGHSQYNPAHGPMKALLHGIRDDIAIAGHRHESAYSVLKDPDTGRIGHAIKVASYKYFDRYALGGRFQGPNAQPVCCHSFAPRATCYAP
jgi:hypothetical protein